MAGTQTRTYPSNVHGRRTPSTASSRVQAKRRRSRLRLLMFFMLMVFVAVGLIANVSPLRAYLESRNRLETKQSQVAALEQQ